MIHSEPAPRASLDDWDQMVDTNCKGLMYLTRAVLPFMHLDRVEPIVDAFANAGFGAVSSRPLPELTNEATGTAVPYVIVATK